MLINRIDFYLLQNPASDTKWTIACRLLEKAYTRGHQVFVFCNNKTDAEYIDELLWTFKDDSFIPHNLQGEGPEPPPPIQIGYDAEPRGFSDILLNLSPDIPVFYKRFKRIMEIVPNDETAKEASRINYRQYRAEGCEMYTHHVG